MNPPYLEEGPQLSRLLKLSASFSCQLFQLLQAGRDMVDTVTDHLWVTRLVTWETTKLGDHENKKNTISLQ